MRVFRGRGSRVGSVLETFGLPDIGDQRVIVPYFAFLKHHNYARTSPRGCWIRKKKKKTERKRTCSKCTRRRSCSSNAVRVIYYAGTGERISQTIARLIRQKIPHSSDKNKLRARILASVQFSRDATTCALSHDRGSRPIRVSFSDRQIDERTSEINLPSSPSHNERPLIRVRPRLSVARERRSRRDSSPVFRKRSSIRIYIYTRVIESPLAIA